MATWRPIASCPRFRFMRLRTSRAICARAARPAPRAGSTRETARSGQFDAAIQNPTWESPDSILFMGVQDRGNHRVYRYRVSSKQLTALTDERLDVAINPFQPLFAAGE